MGWRETGSCSQVSYNVLEFELGRLREAAAPLEAAGKDVPIGLTTRLQALEFRREMLQLQVESGALSLDAYLEQLREAVPREKARSRPRTWCTPIPCAFH